MTDVTEILLTKKDDFGDVVIARLPPVPLGEGEISVDIGPCALTANNITYMVTGDQIGYWQYFDPAAYGIAMDGYGTMPVWGYGTVRESRAEGIAAGTRLYGFFPLAQDIVMRPHKLTQHGFQDGAAHRRPLHSLYNSYSFIDADPSFGSHQDLQPILRPLFTTSFLLDDFMGAENCFGAQQILLLSASSKTALGTAFCLKARGGVKVAGLTSARNADFVKGTGLYDSVHRYDAIEGMDGTVPTVIIDMAGNGEVSAQIYDKFGANIVYNCMVGKSHWQGARPPKPDAGARPIMFFAPDYAKSRLAEWSPAGFAQRLGARWLPFCTAAQDWLSVTHLEGAPAVLKCYRDHLNGSADPKTGYLFQL